MIKAFAVDDELPALRGMEYLLERAKNIEFKLFQNHLEAIEKVKTDFPDVVFLDIDMPSANGIELALKLQDIKPDIIIVFVTAHSEFAVDAFKAYPLDYILKPIDEERFEKTLGHIQKIIEEKSTKSESMRANPVKIRCLGSFDFIVQHQSPISHKNGRRFQELFAYLIFRNGEAVTRSKLIDTMFDGVMDKKNINYIHVVVYNLRKLLTEYGISYTLSFNNESYTLNISTGFCDIVDLCAFVKNNRVVDESNYKQAAALAACCNGDYFENADYNWIPEARAWANLMVGQFLLRLSKYYLGSGKYYDCEKCLATLLKKDPSSQSAHKLLLSLYLQQENKLSYIKHYEKYRKFLKTELGKEPEEELKSCYKRFLREMK
jgi:two-component system, LytTR family, response regulator